MVTKQRFIYAKTKRSTMDTKNTLTRILASIAVPIAATVLLSTDISAQSIETTIPNHIEQKDEAQISYTDARLNPEKRAEYIQQLNERLGLPEYLDKRIYISENPKSTLDEHIYSNSDSLMATAPIKKIFPWSSIGAKILHSQTIILPKAFDIFSDEEGLKVGLYHELNMAKIIYQGLDRIKTMDFFTIDHNQKRIVFDAKLFAVTCELESFDKDIERAEKLNMPIKTINFLKEQYNSFYDKLNTENYLAPNELTEQIKEIYRPKGQ